MWLFSESFLFLDYPKNHVIFVQVSILTLLYYLLISSIVLYYIYIYAHVDYLFPASGFQSLQFRMLECKLGLPAQKRMKYAGRR